MNTEPTKTVATTTDRALSTGEGVAIGLILVAGSAFEAFWLSINDFSLEQMFAGLNTIPASTGTVEGLSLLLFSIVLALWPLMVASSASSAVRKRADREHLS